MLKTRVIPILLLFNDRLVKSIRFDELRNLGNPTQTARVYNDRGVDELVLLDIAATREKRSPLWDAIRGVAEECFMPLAVGGGIKTVNHIRTLLQLGADKVTINTQAIERPEFVEKASQLFGRQCIVISIDAKIKQNGYEVYSHNGKKPTGLNPITWAKRVEVLGAGEILLTSIDQDGTMEGYDLALIRTVADAVNIPVIAAGGAGVLSHFADAITSGHASAVAAASIFHFTDATPRMAKYLLKSRGIPVRLP